MIDFEEAIKRPFTSLGVLAFGGLLLSLIWVLSFAANVAQVLNILVLLIGFFWEGFLIEVAHFQLIGKKKVPSWSNFRRLFLSGVMAMIVSIVYWLPTILLMVPVVMFLITLPSSEISVGGIISLIFFGTAAGIVGLVTWYIAPLALVRYARSYRLKDAFAFRTVFRQAFTITYFTAFLFVFSYGLALLVLGIISVITIIGPLIALFLLPAAHSITMYMVYASVVKKLDFKVQRKKR